MTSAPLRLAALISVLTFFTIGCRSIPPLPPTDFSQPGWTVRQGQALWRPTLHRPELAGELLLATHTNGNYFVQFTKNPFPLATAQVVAGDWQIEFGSGEHSWRNHGSPPARFVWFQLPPALANQPVSPNWRFTPCADHSWRFENPRTGESLEGSFDP